ncbi:DUF6483 family protein [Paenibacillus whitsoniae]|uniref:Tetratricopeptide repeat protein n=1 Tax=Paenibacillus whitsoniae TaxID=2496558 RepID=A0A430J3V9_9BACL|nr:DUF6483 family protein [Paenibacillus whitsoniae]RTE00554.1 hypothetical protein EJQ19_31275 [Paenibacillus whitsoniae]
MFKRDYLLKQIEQLTVVLHRILFQKKFVDIEDAQRQLDEASRHVLGLNLRSLRSLSTKDILELLTYQGQIDTAKALVIHDLFVGQGDFIKDNVEKEEAYWAYVKALELLLLLGLTDEVEPDDEVMLEIKPRLEGLHERLQGWRLPAETQKWLLPYYDKMGSYAKAEDALFHYIEDHPEDRTMPERGAQFYEKLLDIDEERLTAGNFSREEALEGLKLMQSKLQG